MQIDDSILLTKFIQQDTTNTSSSAQSRSAKRQQYLRFYGLPVSSGPRREEARSCLAQSSGRPTQASNSSNRKPAVGWGSTKRGWGRDDNFLEGSVVRDKVTQLRSLRKLQFCLELTHHLDRWCFSILVLLYLL